MSQISCTGDQTPCDCPASDLMELIGRKYAMEIVCVLSGHGTVRFSQIEDHVPDASTSTLSARLDELEAEGLVSRQRYDEIPPRVEYELTDDGEELGERFRPVAEWLAERDSAN